ncbi:ABC transporter permease [Leifsonia aquatica]|uniref:ABC transporter permease n=1 Tax=Leifsonia aquatica TaxID=144185 RepID=UPI003850567C
MSSFARGWRRSRRELKRLAPGAIGLAAGAAVMMATLTGIGAVERTVSDGVEGLGGFGQLGIVPTENGATLDERDLAAVSSAPGVALAVPTLSRRTVIRATGSSDEQSVTITGYPPELNDRVSAAATSGRLPREGAPEVLLPDDIAASLRAEVGDSVVIASPSGPIDLRIVGIADAKKLGVLAYENVFTNLRLVQRIFGDDHRITRVDLMLDVPAEEWELSESASLPAGSRVQDTSALSSTLSPILSALRWVMIGLAVLMSLLGALLGASAYADVVARRQQFYSTLRAVGATRAWMVRSLLTESLAVTVVAVAVGLLAGSFGSLAIQAAVTPLIGGDPALSPPGAGDVLVVVALGMLAGLAAAAKGLIQLARIQPVLGLTSQVVRRRNRMGWGLSLGGTAVLAAVLASLPRSPLHDAIAVVALVVAAALASVALLPVVGRIGAARWTRSASLRRMRQRGGVTTVTAVAGAATAVIIALLSGATAIADATVAQIGKQFGSDVQVASTVAQSSDAIGADLRAVDGVKSVATLVTGTVSLSTASYSCDCDVLAADPSDYFAGADFSWMGTPGDIARARLEGGGFVALPTALAEKADARPGDTVTLGHGDAVRSFTVAGTFGAMITGNQMFMTRADAEELGVATITGWNIAVREGTSIAIAQDRIESSVGSVPGVTVISAAQMRERAASEVLGYTAVVFAIAVVLAVFICVAASIGFSVNQRKRSEEFAVLRAVGASRTSSAMLAASDAINTGVAAAVGGLLFGILAGGLVTRVIGGLLGATLSWNPALPGSITIAIAMALAVQLAAWASIRTARRVQPMDALRKEI